MTIALILFVFVCFVFFFLTVCVFSLKDVFETVLLADLVAAVEKSVDERLWRHVFYAPIEELRAELRKVTHGLTEHGTCLGGKRESEFVSACMRDNE